MKESKKKIIYLIVLFGLLLIDAFCVYKIYRHDKKIGKILRNKYEIVETVNSPKRLNVPGAYGDNQSYHPKVIAFEKKWNGYKYWMSFTPYPNADSSKENPHVKVSNDMINWVEPKEGINPLDEVEETENGKRYNSDSHLVFNDDKNELECWWRFVDDTDGTITIYRMVTKNGTDWSKKEKVYHAKRSTSDWLSPAIIYEDGTYKVWYVSQDNKVMYTESKDLEDFSKPVDLKIDFEESVVAWHLDTIHTEKGYEMIIVAYLDWNHRAEMNLYYTYSKDNKVYSEAMVIMRPTKGTKYWDNSGLYRSSFIYEDGEYYIFYSGQGTNNAKGIGLMHGKDIFKLKTVKY